MKKTFITTIIFLITISNAITQKPTISPLDTNLYSDINKDGIKIENEPLDGTERTSNPKEFENQNQTLLPGENDIVPRE